jgi:hypothetical protein
MGVKHIFDAHRQAVHGALNGLAIQPLGVFQGGIAGNVREGMDLGFLLVYLVQAGLDIGLRRQGSVLQGLGHNDCRLLHPWDVVHSILFYICAIDGTIDFTGMCQSAHQRFQKTRFHGPKHRKCTLH